MKFQYRGRLKFFDNSDNSDVTEETNDCTQYYCYNPAKLLALVRRACPVRRDSSHNNPLKCHELLGVAREAGPVS